MNNRSVIKRIRKIEDIIVLKPREDLVVVWSFGSDDEPHGVMGGHITSLVAFRGKETIEYYAIPYDEEMRVLHARGI